jgi:hypothetical protein
MAFIFHFWYYFLFLSLEAITKTMLVHFAILTNSTSPFTCGCTLIQHEIHDFFIKKLPYAFHFMFEMWVLGPKLVSLFMLSSKPKV